MLVGGYAVGYHGYPRATNDLDVWVARDKENAERLVAALQEFGFAGSDVSPELFMQERQIVRMGMPPIRIEIITSASGVGFDECYAEHIIANVEDVPVNLIGLAQLKVNKKASGRHKDLDDLEHLP